MEQRPGRRQNQIVNKGKNVRIVMNILFFFSFFFKVSSQSRRKEVEAAKERSSKTGGAEALICTLSGVRLFPSIHTNSSSPSFPPSIFHPLPFALFICFSFIYLFSSHLPSQITILHQAGGWVGEG